MTENDRDAEELLQQSKDQRRHTAEPADAGDGDQDGNEFDPLAEAILEGFDAIDAGELSTQVQTRDEDLAAILEGLTEQPLDLSRVVDGAADELDVDAPDDPKKADVVRLLVRVGLRQIDEKTVEAARDAKREHAAGGL